MSATCDNQPKGFRREDFVLYHDVSSLVEGTTNLTGTGTCPQHDDK